MHFKLAVYSYHEKDFREQQRELNAINFSLANIQGLITNRRNICKFVKDVTASGTKHQVIVLTETWTKNNYDAEITEHFRDYNIMKVDRHYDPKLKDPYQLKTRGGTMILTSPSVTITPEVNFSNGNCEVAIGKLPTINTVVISMYRPSGKN